MSQKSICPLCDSRPAVTHAAREMMFGTREPFIYAECAACGSLWLSDPPADLSRFYPPEYYSLAPQSRSDVGPVTRARRAVFRHLVRAAFGGGTVVDQRLLRWRPVPEPFASLVSMGVPFSANVLDVGAGRGSWLRELRVGGLDGTLLGIDPYLDADRHYSDGVTIRKASLDDVAGGCWDLIAFHHVLEHLSDPVGALARSRELLAPGGRVLVRVPTCSSVAWELYGTDWVQLDSPRHLVVPSRRGLAIAAERAGLRIARLADDSTDFQFWGSERYRADLPLFGWPPPVPLSNRAELAAEAKRLNTEGCGDQVVCWLVVSDREVANPPSKTERSATAVEQRKLPPPAAIADV